MRPDDIGPFDLSLGLMTFRSSNLLNLWRLLLVLRLVCFLSMQAHVPRITSFILFLLSCL